MVHNNIFVTEVLMPLGMDFVMSRIHESWGPCCDIYTITHFL